MFGVCEVAAEWYASIPASYFVLLVRGKGEASDPLSSFLLIDFAYLITSYRYCYSFTESSPTAN